jgi:hypothetical protein
MTTIRDLFPIVVPTNRTKPEFCNQSVIPLPGFKVNGKPGASFGGPECARALERVAASSQARVRALETLVVLVDVL